VNYQNVDPAVSSEFNDCSHGSCTAASAYGSSSSFAGNPSFAWFVLFDDGVVGAGLKGGGFRVRAVRGGL
jgi:hypothetical protein